MYLKGGGNINQRLKGCRRDNDILTALEQYRALNTDQVWVKFFSDIPTGRRKAQERLLKLQQRKQVNRYRLENGTFAYYLHKPKLIEHLIGVNWGRLWLERQARSWETTQWQYEVKFRSLRADGLLLLRNNFTGKYRAFLVEHDCATNPFNKVKLYNKAYQEEEYTVHWWAKYLSRFPPIVVITTTPVRAKNIQKIIATENICNLEFQVYLISQIVKEVMYHVEIHSHDHHCNTIYT